MISIDFNWFSLILEWSHYAIPYLLTYLWESVLTSGNPAGQSSGNPFLIHFNWFLMDFNWFSLILIDFSLILMPFHWIVIDFNWFGSPLCHTILTYLWDSVLPLCHTYLPYIWESGRPVLRESIFNTCLLIVIDFQWILLIFHLCLMKFHWFLLVVHWL